MDASVVPTRAAPRAVALVLCRVCAVARVGAEPEVPGLPGVSRNNPKRRAFIGEARRRRADEAQIELRAVPVKRCAGGGDPLRVGVGGEEARLLGVGAEAARNRQVEPGLLQGGGRQAVERDRHVGAHRLSHPAGQRALVPAPAGEGGTAGHRAGGARQRGGRRQLGGGAPSHPDGCLAGPSVHRNPGLSPGGDRNPGGREGISRKHDVPRDHAHPVAAGHAHRRASSQRQIGRGRQMPRIWQPVLQVGRLEQPRIGPAHGSRRRHRGQVGRALMAPLRAQRLAEGTEDRETHQQRSHHAQQQDRGLPALAAEIADPGAKHHGPTTLACARLRLNARAEQIGYASVTTGGGPPAVVLGGDVTALAVARSLGSAGVEVHALGSGHDSVRHSRFCARFVDLGADEHVQERWLTWLSEGSSGGGSDSLLGRRPRVDGPAPVISARVRARTDRGERRGGAGDAGQAADLCVGRQGRHPGPCTAMVRNEDELRAAEREIGYPCALKPVHAHIFRRRLPGKGFLVDDGVQLERAFAPRGRSATEVYAPPI